MDVHRMVLIENDPSLAASPSGDQLVAPALSVDELGPNEVRVTAAAEGPSYLVLNDFFHRGWTARVDGQPARVFIANALFRGVAIDAGTHVVDFRFEPVSHLVGAGVSVLCLVLVLVAIAWGLRGRVARN
jgi:uncharacterized membrane protein YfhO